HPGHLAGRSGERPRDSVRIAVSAAQPTVVIVGAGFGGLRAARALRRAAVNVVLLDRHNYHLFQPLLYQVATAGLEPEQIARPVRAIVRGQENFEFRMVEVTGLDPAGKRVVTDNGPVAYDYLILAVGGETNYFGLEGIARRGFGLKDIPDALAIRNHVLRRFENAMLEPDPERRRAELTFVVVGGGPTGVEMAGALSELIRLVLVKDYPRLNVKDVRILLLEATDRRRGLPRGGRPAAADDGPRGAPDGRDGRRQRHPPAARGAPSGVPLPRPRLARHHRPQCRRRLHPRDRFQGVPGLGGVADRAPHPAHRIPQQAVRAAQLGLGLLLLRTRRAPD